MKSFCQKMLLVFTVILGPCAFYFVFIEPYSFGDLCKMGKFRSNKEYHHQMTSAEYAPNFHTIDVDSLKFIKDSNYILTIGDSFSNRGDFGYQNLLALRDSSLKIYNIKELRNPVISAIGLLNNGYFDANKIDCVIVECVERHLLEQLVISDMTSLIIPDEIQISDSELPLNKYFSWLRLLADIDNHVVKVPIVAPLFSINKSEHTLCFYDGDLNFQHNFIADGTIARQKLLDMKALFDHKGVRLYFMVAVDKYDLYSSYIVGKRSLLHNQ